MKNLSTRRNALIFVALMVLFTLAEVNANHIRGGYLTGEQTGELSFTFTVYLYRDMDGVPAQSGLFEFGHSSATPTLVEPESLGITANGKIELLKYTVAHVFPSAGEYKVSYYEQNRNLGVRNMLASGQTPFYIQSVFKVSPMYQENFSPRFSLVPMGELFAFTSTKLNLFPYDVDGDSLSFRLVVPKQGVDDAGEDIDVNSYFYPNHHTFQQGEQGKVFEIDSVSGILTIDVPETGEYYYAVYADEWRDGVKISSVCLDIEFVSIESSNDSNSNRFAKPFISFNEETCFGINESRVEAFRIKNADTFEVTTNFENSSYIHLTEKVEADIKDYHNVFELVFTGFPAEEVTDSIYTINITANRGYETISREWNFHLSPGSQSATPDAEFTAQKDSVILSWDSYQSFSASEVSVWRFSGDISIFSTNCLERGKQIEMEFEKIGVVAGTDTVFIDQNGGMPFGEQPYFYVLRATYSEAEELYSPFSDIALATSADNNFATLRGTVFYDENRNDTLDDGESLLKGIEVTLLPTGQNSTSDLKGEFEFEVPFGLYQIGLEQTPDWKLLNSDNWVVLDKEETVDFNLALVPSYQDISILLSGSVFNETCQSSVDYDLFVYNNGTENLESGMVGFVKDPRLVFVDATLAPDIQKGDSLIWEGVNLAAYQTKRISMTFNTEGITTIGETSGNAIFFSNPILDKEVPFHVGVCNSDPIYVGLDDSQLEKGVILYPNPASESLYVEFSQGIGDKLSYSLRNATGSLIEQKTLLSQPQIGIDLSRVPQGFYILELSIGDSYFKRKLVKE
ncbi:T9SS type A sorting domain-containing protein [Flammeovirgaceae bacterium SG7u.111]|nr:T9SS type A sorting domain-containing protein [Flammeovirgaceae bacterium SG7u.132]WPO34117.1 T9SS type A sorting domain-containing protein [Flammeovirgaceae bacterium SG7u.111]